MRDPNSVNLPEIAEDPPPPTKKTKKKQGILPEKQYEPRGGGGGRVLKQVVVMKVYTLNSNCMGIFTSLGDSHANRSL